MIILDFGSGNTCRNDKRIVKKMYDELAAATDRRDIVVKWQLFEDEPPNVSLDDEVFDYAYYYGKSLGFDTTASVFDWEAVTFLVQYDVPFIKIANRRNLGGVADLAREFGDIVYQSVPDGKLYQLCQGAFPLCCVSEYPAQPRTYKERFSRGQLRTSISDHTVGWQLYKEYKPMIWEKHFVLEHSDYNPDGGEFALTPDDLRKMHEEMLI